MHPPADFSQIPNVMSQSASAPILSVEWFKYLEEYMAFYLLGNRAYYLCS